MRFASCCVLSFNRPDFLRACVESLRENAGHPFELIIHDDGSSNPSSRELIHEWVDAGIVSTAILNPPGHNTGQGVALNRMFSMAKGDPIIKIDQDLTFEPNWLKDVERLMRWNAGPMAPDELYLGLLGLMHYWHEPVDSRETLIKQYEGGYYSGFSSRTHILGSAFAMPRRAWEELGPFEEHSEAFAEDWDMQKRVTASDRWMCALPDIDLAVNHGMGIGPSTVVIGEGQVQPIHTEPVIHGKEQ